MNWLPSNSTIYDKELQCSEHRRNFSNTDNFLVVMFSLKWRISTDFFQQFKIQCCYRPQTKFAKVMFLQVSVCPRGGGVRGCSGGACMVARGGAWLLGGHAWLLGGACVAAPGGVCMVAPRGMCGCSGRCAWLLPGARVVALGGVHGCSQGGMRGCSRGACMVAPGSMRGCSGGACVVAPGGACVVALGGACMGYDEIRRLDQWAGGTHPTGMHSCSVLSFLIDLHVWR